MGATSKQMVQPRHIFEIIPSQPLWGQRQNCLAVRLMSSLIYLHSPCGGNVKTRDLAEGPPRRHTYTALVGATSKQEFPPSVLGPLIPSQPLWGQRQNEDIMHACQEWAYLHSPCGGNVKTQGRGRAANGTNTFTALVGATSKLPLGQPRAPLGIPSQPLWGQRQNCSS